MTTIRKLFDLLSARERRQAAFLMSMMCVMALLDAAGVASIMPFIAVLSNPQMVQSNPQLIWLHHLLGDADAQDFLFTLGAIVFALLVASLAFRAAVTYAQVRFTLMREHSIGLRLITGYLSQPYAWFLNRNSAELGKSVLSEVSSAVHGALVPMMTLVSHGMVAIVLMAPLFLVDSVLALAVCIAMGSAYMLIYVVMRRFLSHIGKARFAANQARFTVVTELFNAVKEVKVRGLEQVYSQRFSGPAAMYATTNASSHTVAQLPRFALEAVCFGGMLLLILYLMGRHQAFTEVLPVVAVYAFAGYRLLPALQHIYASVSQIRFAGPALDALHADLTGLPAGDREISDVPAMQLQKNIELRAVEFAYPECAKKALIQVNLAIPARTTLGVVGTTGSGKTTLVDMILGLLEPQQGQLCVDGTLVNGLNRRAWQAMIGYVPQHIYLADDTIAANIAFGVNPDEIDRDALQEAAKAASLHMFVMQELPQHYDTIVGERGVRLSGGQRQRIGIARALYFKPQVLILDEATSALDTLTEQTVMQAIHALRQEMTIIQIAHRLSTIRLCDAIVLMENGRIKAQGTFDELVQQEASFKAMASA